jgi:hypothetical protein
MTVRWILAEQHVGVGHIIVIGVGVAVSKRREYKQFLAWERAVCDSWIDRGCPGKVGCEDCADFLAGLCKGGGDPVKCMQDAIVEVTSQQAISKGPHLVVPFYKRVPFLVRLGWRLQAAEAESRGGTSVFACS